MLKARRSALAIATVAGLTLVGLTAATTSKPHFDRLPDRIADSTFWRMVTTFSENSGSFPSENFVSNETEWQYIIPGALDRIKPVSAYLGVGPEQNFTYIANFHPKIAFICDIRRQNMIVHLMYKALIEMSGDRVDFLSKLWSRRRPDSLVATSSAGAILEGYARQKPDSFLYNINLSAIFDRLVNKHKFGLSSADSATMRAVFGVFYADGPDISYSSSSNRRALGGMNAFVSGNGTVSGMLGSGYQGIVRMNNNGTVTQYVFTTDSIGRPVVLRDSAGKLVRDTTFNASAFSTTFSTTRPAGLGGGGAYASFGYLMTEDDGSGLNRGWLGSETAFQSLKDFETRNLLIPVVGDFAGPKALRAIANYLTDHEARVSAFYTSNVEQYLFQNHVNESFYANVAALPIDSNSFFIRSFSSNNRYYVPPFKSNSRMAQSTSSIGAILRAHQIGTLRTYADLAMLQDPR